MTATAPDPTAPRFGPWARERRSLVEFFALTGVAIAQPVFDILAKNSDIFVTRHTTGAQTVLFVLVVLAVPALVLWVAEVLIGLCAPRARPWVHAVLAAIVVGVITVEVVKRAIDIGTAGVVAIAVAVGAGSGFLVLGSSTARLFLRYLALAPVVFAVLFLAFSPVTSVVFREGPKAAGGVTIGKPSRVVMIVMDEFPLESLLDGTGHIDSTLYPNFAELAGTSTWYRNSTTVAPYTEVAVPAILTGDLPSQPHAPPAAAVYPRNLFTLLGGAYDMNVHESATSLCPKRVCTESRHLSTSTDDGLRGLLEDSFDAWTSFASPEETKGVTSFGVRQGDSEARALDRGEQFVSSLRPGDAARLDFLHVLLPHQPWHYLGSGQDNGHGLSQGLAFLAWANQWTADAGRVQHLLQVQASDRLLGQIIAKLKRVGAWDQSLVVLTADHGVSFTGKRSVRGVAAETYPQIMWIPLFVKAPSQAAGVVDDRPVESVDVLPTIAAHLQLRMPWRIDGRSALGPPRPDGPRPLFEWKLNQLQPPPGRKYLKVNGPVGFQDALAGRATDATGDPRLRLYRLGEYSGLIGARAGPLTTGSASDDTTASLAHPEIFRNIDPTARSAPWTYVNGHVPRHLEGTSLAVVVNGRVGAIAKGYGSFVESDIAWWASVPPQFFRRGNNRVALAIVDGPPESPRLTPLRLTG